MILQDVVNRYRRMNLPTLLLEAHRRYPPLYQGHNSVQRLTATTVLKQGPSPQIEAEVEAMRLVASHTSIPLPKVHDYWLTDDKGFIVMEFIDAENLNWAFFNSLTEQQRHHVVHTIVGYVEQLRQISQPPMVSLSMCPGWIGSAGGGPFYDPRISQQDGPFGPFATQREFNDWRISLYEAACGDHQPSLARLRDLRDATPDNHRVVFTHADLHKGNIMVRVHGEGDDEVDIVAILDWGCAGWRPSFWEGMKMTWLGSRHRVWKNLCPLLQAGFETDVQREVDLCLVNGGMPAP